MSPLLLTNIDKPHAIFDDPVHGFNWRIIQVSGSAMAEHFNPRARWRCAVSCPGLGGYSDAEPEALDIKRCGKIVAASDGWIKHYYVNGRRGWIPTIEEHLSQQQK